MKQEKAYFPFRPQGNEQLLLGTAKELNNNLKLQFCWAPLDLSSYKPTLCYVKMGIKLKSYFIYREIHSETGLK